MNLEGFEIIKDFPNYMINKKGDVYSLNRKRLLYPSQDKDGYFRVGLSKNGKVKHCRINRLIMLQFHPIDTPEKYVVNHIDGNKQNNDINNLEWCTPYENFLHAIKTGLYNPQGESNNRAKLSNKDVSEIRRLYKEGHRIADIQKIYNMVTWENIKFIVTYQTFKNQ